MFVTIGEIALSRTICRDEINGTMPLPLLFVVGYDVGFIESLGQQVKRRATYRRR